MTEVGAIKSVVGTFVQNLQDMRKLQDDDKSGWVVRAECTMCLHDFEMEVGGRMSRGRNLRGLQFARVFRSFDEADQAASAWNRNILKTPVVQASLLCKPVKRETAIKLAIDENLAHIANIMAALPSE